MSTRWSPAILSNNLGATASTTGTSSATVSGLGWTKLTDPQPRHRARVNATSAILVLNLGSRTMIDCAGLISTSLSASATVRLRLSASDNTGAAGDLYDSGVQSNVTDPAWNGNVIACLANADGSTAKTNPRYVRWDITDASAPIDIGLAPVGLVFRPTYNFSFGSAQEGRNDLSQRDVNPDTGAEFAVNKPQKRTKIVSFDAFTKSEARTTIDDMDRLVGAAGDILFIEDVLASWSDRARYSIWGGFRSGSNNLSTRRFNDVFSRPLQLVERL